MALPYTTLSGFSHTRTTACVTTPNVPSLPSMTWCTSGPVLMRGTTTPFSSTRPSAVTIDTACTISSIFPYRFFRIPDALVATHPPRELNSIESGSWPRVRLAALSAFSMSLPMAPAWMTAVKLARLMERMADTRRRSSDTIMRRSRGGQRRDWETVVPPP